MLYNLFKKVQIRLFGAQYGIGANRELILSITVLRICYNMFRNVWVQCSLLLQHYSYSNSLLLVKLTKSDLSISHLNSGNIFRLRVSVNVMT